MLNIIYLNLLFGPIIPLLWPATCFNLILIYWVQKIIFTRFCSPFPVFNHKINDVVIWIAKLGVVLSCFTTPLIYGGIKGLSISQRFITYMYFPILGAIVLFYKLFRKILVFLKNKIKENFFS